MAEVRNWLRKYGLQKYSKILEEDGWEKLSDLFEIDEDDLKTCMDKPGHRKRFHLAVQETKSNGSQTRATICIKEPTGVDDEDDWNTCHPRTKLVEGWLKKYGLGQYIIDFKNGGWDIPEVVVEMDEENIKACINKPGHRKKFYQALKHENLKDIMETHSQLSESELALQRQDLENWLKRNNLEQYINSLEEDGWDSIDVLFEIIEDEENLKRCIEKPGHRKRFKLAVNSIKNNASTEEVIQQQKDRSNTCASELNSGKEADEQINYPVDFEETTTSETHSAEIRNSKTEYDPNAERSFYDDRQTLNIEPLTGTEDSFSSDQAKKDAYPYADNSENTRVEVTITDHQENEPVTQKLPVKFGLDFEDEESQCTPNDAGSENFTDQKEGLDNAALVSSSKFKQKETIAATGERRRSIIHRTFSMPPSTTYIYGARNVSVGGKIFEVGERTFSEEEKTHYDNYRKQMKTALEGLKEKDSLFVETKAYKNLETNVKTNHWAVIIGVPGDGKTAMAAHLSLKYYKNGYETLELHFAKDWKDYVGGNSGNGSGKKQFILIDDIFGRMSTDERKVNDWSAIIEVMQNVITQRKGALKVVCTTRKYVFEDVKSKLAHFVSFHDSMIIDTTQKQLALTVDEKIAIWNKYMERYKVTSERPYCVEEEMKTPHGFPHCVDIFARSPNLQKTEGILFFENPMQCICKEIENFKHNDKTKYCVLLLLLFNNNHLTDVEIEEMPEKSSTFIKIVSKAGLSNHPTGSDLKKALHGLSNTYVTEVEDCYCISHDSIRENLAFVFIKQNTTYAIEHIDFDYLTDHTKCSTKPGLDHSKIFELKLQHYPRLVKRIIQEIKMGNVVTVCAHQAWNNKVFVENFISELLRPKCGDAEQSVDTRISEVLNTKESSASYIFDYSLIDALRFFGHRDAVQQIVNNKKVSDILDHVDGQGEKPADLVFDRPLSLRLFRVMDKIGASPALRKFQVYSAISMELLDTVCVQIAEKTFRCYIFGSHSEGTRIITHIQKRDCDVNYIFCENLCEVIQNVSEITADQNIQYYLTATDEITKPGYVKLQFVQGGIPLTRPHSNIIPKDAIIDHHNRIVLCKRRPEKIHVDEIAGSKATAEMVTGAEHEIYTCYRCRSWPKIATKWLSRNRHFNWPSRSAIEQMKSLGVFLVPVGSEGSIEKNLEWKILFLLQERMLMSIVNETQYKCYIILKMINNDIISRQFKKPVLVSYHLKTCLFYIIENTQTDLWKPENFLDCVNVCLRHILKCTIEGNFPNYFIPQNNMFYGRVHGEVQTKLRTVLSQLLYSKVSFWYLPLISCGNLGPRLQQIIWPEKGFVHPDQDLVSNAVRLYLKLVKFVAHIKMRILFKCFDPEDKKCIRSFKETVLQLKETDEIIDHSKDQTETALSLVLPYVELSLMSVLVVKHNLRSDLLLSEKWNEISMSVNPFPIKLKQATFLYTSGLTNASLLVLHSLAKSVGSLEISVCGCQHYHTKLDANAKEVVKNMSETEFRKKHCIPCVAFLPTEKHFIPTVLCYEMSRARAKVNLPESKEPPHFWYDWAVIDGKVLWYLMLYLNYKSYKSDVNLEENEMQEKVEERAKEAIEKLQRVIADDPNLGHKETALNILGWIFRHERDEEMAKNVFQESLNLKPYYNAASLHIKWTRSMKTE